MTGLLLLTGTGVATFILSGRAGTLAGLLTTVYCGVGVLVAVLSFLLMRHYRAEEVERLELDKIKDNYRWQVLLKGSSTDELHALVNSLQAERNVLVKKQCILVIDVDPENMM